MAKARKRRSPRVPLTLRWRVALANKGITQAAWAMQPEHGWTESHVGQVVAGKRESTRVMSAVMQFIAEQESDIAARAASPAA